MQTVMINVSTMQSLREVFLKQVCQSTYCCMVKVRLIMAADPIVHYLEVLAKWMLHIQACEYGDLLVQLPNSGVCRVLQPSTTNKTYWWMRSWRKSWKFKNIENCSSLLSLSTSQNTFNTNKLHVVYYSALTVGEIATTFYTCVAYFWSWSNVDCQELFRKLINMKNGFIIKKLQYCSKDVIKM